MRWQTCRSGSSSIDYTYELFKHTYELLKGTRMNFVKHKGSWEPALLFACPQGSSLHTRGHVCLLACPLPIVSEAREALLEPGEAVLFH